MQAIESDLTATALVLSDGSTKVVVIGIDLSIVSLTCPNAYWGSEAVSLKAAQVMNEELARARKAWPDRIQWLCSLPWQHEKAALAELKRSLKAGACDFITKPFEMAELELAIQVAENKPEIMNLALNNARNLQADLGAANVDIEIVAYGPGIGMLKIDSLLQWSNQEKRGSTAAERRVRRPACAGPRPGPGSGKDRGDVAVPH